MLMMSSWRSRCQIISHQFFRCTSEI